MPAPLKIPAAVTNIADHGRQTYTVILEPGKRIPKFKPGQFLHFALDDYDPSSHWPDSRVFSIASSPTRPDSIRVTYTVKGVFTARMANELQTGSEVWLKFPYGDFVLEDDYRNEMVLIAGGTGFTPFASFAEYLADKDIGISLRIAYGAANPSLLIFRDLIEATANKLPGLRRKYFCEEGAFGDIIPGRIGLDQVLTMIDDPYNTIYYLSGPKLMVEKFRRELRARKIIEELIRIDAWE